MFETDAKTPAKGVEETTKPSSGATYQRPKLSGNELAALELVRMLKKVSEDPRNYVIEWNRGLDVKRENPPQVFHFSQQVYNRALSYFWIDRYRPTEGGLRVLAMQEATVGRQSEPIAYAAQSSHRECDPAQRDLAEKVKALKANRATNKKEGGGNGG